MSFETAHRSALPSLFCSHCLPQLSLFLPPHTILVLEQSTEDAQGEFKLHTAPNCVCFIKLLKGLSCQQKAHSRLSAFFFPNQDLQSPPLGDMLLWKWTFWFWGFQLCSGSAVGVELRFVQFLALRRLTSSSTVVSWAWWFSPSDYFRFIGNFAQTLSQYLAMTW